MHQTNGDGVSKRAEMCEEHTDGDEDQAIDHLTLVLGYLNNVNIQIYHRCLCRRRWSRAEQTFSKAGILCDIGIRTPVRRTSQSTQEKPAPHEGHTHTTRRFHEFIVGHQVRLFVR